MYALDASTHDVGLARENFVRTHYEVPHDCKAASGDVRVAWPVLRAYLSDTALVIWQYLMRLAARDGTAFPSVAAMHLRVIEHRRNIGKRPSISERSIYRALERLQRAGLVSEAEDVDGRMVRSVQGRKIAGDSDALYVPQKTYRWLHRANPMNRPRNPKNVRGASETTSGGNHRRKEPPPKSETDKRGSRSSLSSRRPTPPSAAARRRTRAGTNPSPTASTPSVVREAPPCERQQEVTFGCSADAGVRELLERPETPSVDVAERLPCPEDQDRSEKPAARHQGCGDASAPDVDARSPERQHGGSDEAPSLRVDCGDLGDVDPSTYALRAGGPDARRERRHEKWRAEVDAMPPRELTDAERQAAAEEAALPPEERERRRQILDSLWASAVDADTQSASTTSEADDTEQDVDYDDPRLYEECDVLLRDLEKPSAHFRVPLDLSGLLPEFPSELPKVHSPRYDSLLGPDGKPKSELDCVLLLAKCFRIAMHGAYKQRCFYLTRGDITKSRYYPLLAAAAEMLIERKIVYPAFWCRFAIKRWRSKNPVKAPPLAWVYSPKLIDKCEHWFDELTRYSTISYTIPAKSELLQLLYNTRLEALLCQTREEAALLIQKRIPQPTWDAMCRHAHDQAHQMAAEIRRRRDNEEWVWGDF